MANETTRTSLTEIINSEVIADRIISYAYDAMVIAPLTRKMDLRGKASSVASFPQWELDAVSDITTEGTTTLSNVELQTTEVATISAAAVGILRHVTEHALATNMLGEAGLLAFITQADGPRLCGLEVENDLAALFSGFSTTVGTSGADLTIANFVEAIARMDTANARGRRVCVLDDQQAFDLRAAVASTSGAVFSQAGAQSVLNANGNGFVGELFGVPIWLTNLTDTDNTGADVVGAMFIDGESDPEYAALGMALLWLPKVLMVPVPNAVAHNISISMAYGVGRISGFGVDITTDA